MQAEEQAAAHLERRVAELGPSRSGRARSPKRWDILRKKSKARGSATGSMPTTRSATASKPTRSTSIPKRAIRSSSCSWPGIFAASKAPLKSQGVVAKLVSLDWLGDRVNRRTSGSTSRGGGGSSRGGGTSCCSCRCSGATRRSIARIQTTTITANGSNGTTGLWRSRASRRTRSPAKPCPRRSSSRALRESFPQRKPADRRERTTSAIRRRRLAAELAASSAQDLQLLMAKPARAERQAHLVLGPPAAGKSSFAEPLAEATGARLIDADEAKACCPNMRTASARRPFTRKARGWPPCGERLDPQW
jgi:hypothetical protein